MRLQAYRHPTAGFSLPLPPNWERVDDTPGVALVALVPERDRLFRLNVVVTIEKFPERTTLEEWGQGADELLSQSLDRYMHLDDEPVEIDSRPARRTLAHHTTEDGHAVTMQQWTLVEGNCGYTVTVSAGTLDYDQAADLFGAIAEGFRPDPQFAL